ncbi:lipocalin-like domain protein [Vibrio cholerae CP1048(21)]|nr:lipocalin-like domain protein [Vibrio cholerae CP1048(21)]
MPESVKPVSDFELNNYLGKWYEVARLDHSFERGLSQVTAEYRVRNDGGISVLNRGYSEEKGEWKEAEGKAYFVNGSTDGYLKVSFFGPFYGSYVVFELDREKLQLCFCVRAEYRISCGYFKNADCRTRHSWTSSIENVERAWF